MLKIDRTLSRSGASRWSTLRYEVERILANVFEQLKAKVAGSFRANLAFSPVA